MDAEHRLVPCRRGGRDRRCLGRHSRLPFHRWSRRRYRLILRYFPGSLRGRRNWSGRGFRRFRRRPGLHHGPDPVHLLTVVVNVPRYRPDEVLDLTDAPRVPHPVDPPASEQIANSRSRNEKRSFPGIMFIGLNQTIPAPERHFHPFSLKIYLTIPIAHSIYACRNLRG